MAKRIIHILFNRSKSVFIAARLPKKLWIEILSTIIKITNYTLTTVVKRKTPFKKFKKKIKFFAIINARISSIRFKLQKKEKNFKINLKKASSLIIA